MKKTYIYLIGLFFISYILISCYKEGYINIYETDELFKPDLSFIHNYTCNSDEDEDEDEGMDIIDPRRRRQRKFNDYYNIKDQIKLHINEGTYTSFLNVYDLRSHFHLSKLCESNDEMEYRYKFNTIDNQFRLIPGAFPEEDIQKIYKDELIKDANDFKKPLHLFTNLKNSEKYIIYPKKIQNNILNSKRKQKNSNRPNRIVMNYYKD